MSRNVRVVKHYCNSCGIGWVYAFDSKSQLKLKCPICRNYVSIVLPNVHQDRIWGVLSKLFSRAWMSICFIAYVFLRVSLRILIGKRRRNLVMRNLNLDYRRAQGIRYLCLTSYEPYVHRVIRKILERGGAKTFIDIGAHIGIYTLYAHQIMRRRSEHFRIVAVEPHPVSYSVLERKIKGLTNVVLLKEAVYVEDGETTFYLGSLHRSSSITPTEHHVRAGLVSGEIINIKTVRIDSLIRRLKLERVDLLKMDIEGTEYSILTDPTLDLSVVENMIVEVHYSYRSKESIEMMRALAQKGFKIAPLYPDNSSWAYHLLAFRGNMPW